MRELRFLGAKALAWWDAPVPQLLSETDALVRPFIAARARSARPRWATNRSRPSALVVHSAGRAGLSATPCVRWADQMLVRVPAGVDPLSVASACRCGRCISTAARFMGGSRTPARICRRFQPALVTTLIANWDDAPRALLERSTKVVIRREPRGLALAAPR